MAKKAAKPKATKKVTPPVVDPTPPLQAGAELKTANSGESITLPVPEAVTTTVTEEVKLKFKKPKHSTLTEIMAKIVIDGMTIRCWKQSPVHLDSEEANTVRQAMAAYTEVYNSESDMNKENICEAILAIEDMNAVEVLDAQGNGCVKYKNWP